MHRWMPPCRLRSAPLYPNVRRHSSSAGCLASAATGKASWSRPRRCQMRLHLVPQSASVQKILRFWCLSCPASWLSFSASGHSGFWQYRGWSRRLFRPRSEPAHRRFSSSYWSTSRCTAERAAWAAYISRFCALLNRLNSSGVNSALPNRRCWAFSAVFSASVFSFFFLGTDCSTLAFFGGRTGLFLRTFPL